MVSSTEAAQKCALVRWLIARVATTHLFPSVCSMSNQMTSIGMSCSSKPALTLKEKLKTFFIVYINWNRELKGGETHLETSSSSL